MLTTEFKLKLTVCIKFGCHFGDGISHLSSWTTRFLFWYYSANSSLFRSPLLSVAGLVSVYQKLQDVQATKNHKNDSGL